MPRPMSEVAHEKIKVKNDWHAKNVIAQKSKSHMASLLLTKIFGI